MQTIRSYSVKIINIHKEIRDTVNLYQNCVSDLINVISTEYDNLPNKPVLEIRMYIEHLIHETKENNPKYKFFNRKYYKLPAYLRRSAIADALASVTAYKNSKGKKTLNRHPDKMPCLYRDNMFKLVDEKHACIKLYINHDWLWKTVELRNSDLNYLKKNNLNIEDSCAPILKKCGKKYKLMFCFKNKIDLKENVKTICSVDLGLNNDAVCSIMNKDGTVKARKFINFADDKDHLYRICGQISYRQSIKIKQNRRLWRFVDNRNRELSIRIAKAISEFSSLNNCDAVVFEHLDTNSKKKGSKKQHLHLWRNKDVEKRCESLLHNKGIRFSTVCAVNSSKLAYDGSGEVSRHKDNYSLCTFQNGKQYNCDLSASYNIGARYFIRQILNSLSEQTRLAVMAKVPETAKRSTCTLNTLITLNAVL